MKPRFLQMEFQIITSLNWNLSYATSESFLDLFLDTTKRDSFDRKLGSLFLCELAEFNSEVCFNYSPSSIAVAAIVITDAALQNTKPDASEFDDLETSLLNSVLHTPAIVNSKYVSKSHNGHGAYTSVVIERLTNLATYLDQQQRKQEVAAQAAAAAAAKNSTRGIQSPLQDFTFYPLSPIGSPCFSQYKSSPSPPINHVQPVSNSRKFSGPMLKTIHLDAVASGCMITPGTTPTSSVYSGSCGGSAVSHLIDGCQVITPVQLPHSQSFNTNMPLSQTRFASKSVTTYIADDLGLIADTQDFDAGKCLKRRRV
ncbi:unnamed protein product [Ambrosiozyma monospora]|uniref:Unnamed protein product n=1 Tax=Ambrosiozyma monospora TaxID=43982 RepID=A0A9W6WHD3_AMBMO|nr:unnamed protein product [Ambrosiozyma monospora]